MPKTAEDTFAMIKPDIMSMGNGTETLILERIREEGFDIVKQKIVCPRVLQWQIKCTFIVYIVYIRSSAGERVLQRARGSKLFR